MLHVKLSVRETCIIPAAKMAIDKSKTTCNNIILESIWRQRNRRREDRGCGLQRMGGVREYWRVNLLEPANEFDEHFNFNSHLN